MSLVSWSGMLENSLPLPISQPFCSFFSSSFEVLSHGSNVTFESTMRRYYYHTRSEMCGGRKVLLQDPNSHPQASPHPMRILYHDTVPVPLHWVRKLCQSNRANVLSAQVQLISVVEYFHFSSDSKTNPYKLRSQEQKLGSVSFELGDCGSLSLLGLGQLGLEVFDNCICSVTSLL